MSVPSCVVLLLPSLPHCTAPHPLPILCPMVIGGPVYAVDSWGEAVHRVLGLVSGSLSGIFSHRGIFTIPITISAVYMD